eukprot:TRINITY_DN18271_c0_g1_i1.p2 TRINITY_DN18271_c0_g1~~TRINITY_DN18271_c0_g1_i1.p2  ORF type:complete len:119 (-),score=9.45 TRINITY_DN18271_c0_g1_i1:180-536(-)
MSCHMWIAPAMAYQPHGLFAFNVMPQFIKPTQSNIMCRQSTPKNGPLAEALCNVAANACTHVRPQHRQQQLQTTATHACQAAAVTRRSAIDHAVSYHDGIYIYADGTDKSLGQQHDGK